MKKKIIERALLCAITFMDEGSKISPSLAKRVHSVYEEIYIIMQNSMQSKDLDKKLLYILKNPTDSLYYENIIQELIYYIQYEELYAIVLKLKYLGEFGRLLPYQGKNYCNIPKPIDCSAHVGNIRKRLELSEFKKANTNAFVAIVLCFRIENEVRLRNLYAALFSIYSQDFGRENIKIIAVNQDGEDNYKSTIENYVDQYVFAKNSGNYNYSWARNIGTLYVKDAKYLIFWDIDIVAQRDMVRKICEAFDDKVGCVVPYTSAYNMNELSTSYFLDQMFNLSYLQILDTISAQVMHEVYGMIISVTSKVFYDIGGQDERYEGWGDEDNDFYYRIYNNCNVKRLNNMIFHLDHPRPVMRIDGEKINKKYIGKAKQNDGGIGDLNKYA